jgi:hypothetical protein
MMTARVHCYHNYYKGLNRNIFTLTSVTYYQRNYFHFKINRPIFIVGLFFKYIEVFERILVGGRNHM